MTAAEIKQLARIAASKYAMLQSTYMDEPALYQRASDISDLAFRNLYKAIDAKYAEDSAPKFVEQKYLVGQRVIIKGDSAIGTVVVPPPGKGTHFGIWVYSPARLHACDFPLSSIEPLTDGQL